MRSPSLVGAGLPVVVVILSCSVARAQDPLAATSPVAMADWRVPVHTAPADPVGGAYGIWAAGPDYKVSFHDGFAFYPVLGEGYPRNLPLRWRTDSIRIAGEDVAPVDRPGQSYTDWRFEYRYPGGVTEAYDVRDDGVEQTFVLRERAASSGDLVITGVIETELRAPAGGAANRELVFRDDRGVPVVTYGAAVAFDADRRRVPVTTIFDGKCVKLRLRGDWLADARFPIVVDPLTSSAALSFGNGPASFPDVSRNDQSDELMFAFSRAVSGGDYDTYVRRTDDVFGNNTAIYQDIAAGWSTRYNQCCYALGAKRWAVAMSREFSSVSAGIRVYVHDRDNSTPNSGTVIFLSAPPSARDRHPSIGGGVGVSAYLVFQRDIGAATANSDVVGVTVNCGANPGFGIQRSLSTTTNYDAEWPCVTKDAATGEWVAVWQEYNYANTNDDWDVLARRIGIVGLPLDQGVFGPGGAALHKLRPKISGQNGRFLCAYATATNTGKTSSGGGTTIETQRANWTSNGLTLMPRRVLKSKSGSPTLNLGGGNRGIAYDTDTRSHWAVAYSDTSGMAVVHRVGFNGCSVEAVTLNNGPGSVFSPSAVYNDSTSSFAITFGTSEATSPVYAIGLNYRAAACTTFGAACAGAIACSNQSVGLPHAGSEYFEILMSGGVPNRPYSLFLSTQRGNVPLGGGCELRLGGVIVPVTTVLSDQNGRTRLRAPLSDCPLVIGDVYAQYFTVTGVSVRSTDAVKIEVR